MKPATFGDLNKSAKDLLTKDYSSDVKVEVETKTANGVTFSANSKSVGGFNGASEGEMKMKLKDSNLTCELTASTKNTLKGKVTMENQGMAGLKLTAEGTQSPASATVGATLKQDHFAGVLDIKTKQLSSFDLASSVSVGYEGFLFGASGEFNTDKQELAKVQFALAYKAGDWSLHTLAKDKGDALTISWFHQCAPTAQWGGDFTHNRAKSTSAFNIGTRMTLPDNNAFVKAKVNQKGTLSVAYGQDLRPGLKGVISVDADTKNNMSQKFGLKLVINQ